MARSGRLPPAGTLDATLIDWGKNKSVFRVHVSGYGVAYFNSTRSGDARFSPLVRNDGQVVPTLYVGTSLDCALMETVFHDVPYASGIKTVAKASHVSGRAFSAIRLTRDFRLIDLSSIALRKLGIPRSRLIDTDAYEYPNTRQWALALYERQPAAQGLLWTSRQDDSAQGVLFFGDRTENLSFSQISGPTSLLLSDGSAIPELLSLAMRLGVLLV